jgi:hypothetical protein
MSRNLLTFLSKTKPVWAPVAHACNPSYSGGGDQEDHNSKPAKPYLEKPYHKKKKLGWWSGSR